MTEPLDELAKIVAGCTSCPLHEGRKQAIFGDGPRNAPVMLVAEAPNQRDDEKGRLFSAKQADYLADLLTTAKIPANAVYVTSVLKCHPPKNRFPEDDSPTMCVKYLVRQIELIDPVVVVVMGRNALQTLLLAGTGQSPDPFTAWVGQHLRRRDRFSERRFVVSYPLSHLLRTQSPDDEELTIATLSDAWLYVEARLDGKPAPALNLTDLNTAPPPMWQSRSLWR